MWTTNRSLLTSSIPLTCDVIDRLANVSGSSEGVSYIAFVSDVLIFSGVHYSTRSPRGACGGARSIAGGGVCRVKTEGVAPPFRE
jgi:hypothetical protein